MAGLKWIVVALFVLFTGTMSISDKEIAGVEKPDTIETEIKRAQSVFHHKAKIGLPKSSESTVCLTFTGGGSLQVRLST